MGGFPYLAEGIPDKYCSMPYKAAVQHMLGSTAPLHTVGVISWDSGTSEVSQKSLPLPGDLTGGEREAMGKRWSALFQSEVLHKITMIYKF